MSRLGSSSRGRSIRKTKTELEAYCKQLERELADARLQLQSSRVESRDTGHPALYDLDAFFELSPDLLCVVDTDGYFRKLNPAWERVLGFTQPELDAARFLDFVHPADMPATRDAMRQLRVQQRVIRFVNRFRKRDATYCALEWSAAAAGEMIFAIAHDVTAARSFLAQLQESDARYRSLLEAMDEGIVMQNAAGEIIASNRSAERILGLPIDEMVGRPSTDKTWQSIRKDGAAYPGQEHPAMVALRTGESIRNAVMGVHKPSGELVWIQSNSIPLWHAGQEEPYAAVTTFTDVTASRQTEDWLRTERDLSRALSGPLGLDDALRTILHAAFHLEGIDCGGIYLVDLETGVVELVVHEGLPAWFIREASEYPADSPNAELIRIGSPIYLDSRKVPFGLRNAREQVGLRGLAIIPVLYQGRAIASLNLASYTHDEIPAASRPALETLAAQSGAVIARILAERALQETRDNLQILFDTLDDFLFILDDQGKILQSNPVVVRRLGYTRQELTGQHVLFVHPPERADEAMRIIEAMLAGSEAYCPVPLRAKDGTLIPVETKVSRGRWGNRDVLFGISRDMTERNRMEAALRESEVTYRQLFTEHAAIMLLIDPATGEIVDANPAASRFYGYAIETLRGMNINAINTMPPEKILASMKDAQSREQNYFVFPHRLASGRERQVEVHSTPMQVRGKRLLYSIIHDVTDRVEAENRIQQLLAELQQQHDFLTRVFNTMGQGLTVTNAKGQFEYVNPAYARLFGYTPEDLLGRTPNELTVSEDLAALEAARTARQRGETTTYENRLVRKDNTIASVLITGVPRWRDGQVAGAIAVITDLTQLKQAEQALRESEELFRKFVEQSGDGITLLDEQGLVIEWNRALEMLTGYMKAEMLGKSFFEMLMQITVEPYNREELIRPISDIVARTIETGQGSFLNRIMEAPFATAEGEKRTVQQVVFLIPTQRGHRIGVIVRDVTDQKQMLQVLAAERSLLRAVIDLIPDQIFAKDLEGRFVINNRADAAAMGVTDPETLVGKNDFDVYPPELAHAFRADDRRVMATEQELQSEEPTQDGDGNGRWVLVHKVPWRNSDGHVVGLVGIAMDITARRRMEQEVRDLNQQLQIQIEQLRHLEGQLREQSVRDPLTQLYNRRYLNETLPREIARALRLKQELGILMLDIDHFKTINDMYGHAAGDEALQNISRRIMTRLRASDIVCRYGGEEILCLLPGTTSKIVARRAEELRAAISELCVVAQHPHLRVTVSIGAAILPADGTEMSAALQAADDALYAAKVAGRNCVRFSHPAHRTPA